MSGQPISKPKVFISHASHDAGLANALKEQIDRVFAEGLAVFCTSYEGTISPGTDWLKTIERELQEARAVIVLVTPVSITRPWLWFEIGAAWLKSGSGQSKIYPLCSPQFELEDLPQPLNRLEGLSLKQPAGLKQLFRDLADLFGFGSIGLLQTEEVISKIPDYTPFMTDLAYIYGRVLPSMKALALSETKLDSIATRMEELLAEADFADLHKEYTAHSRRFGVAYDYQRIKCVVDPKGGATITRKAKLSAYQHVDAIAVYLHLPERDEATGLLRPQIESKTEGRTLTPGEPVWLSSRMMSTVKISPPLEDGDSVELVVHEGAYAEVFRTPRHHMVPKTANDYVAWDLTYPTRELELRVQFPPRMVIESFESDVWVWVGSSRPRHMRERERIGEPHKAPSRSGLELVLTVPFPLLSVTYAVSWFPDKAYGVPISQS
jgi:hypothetical protein